MKYVRMVGVGTRTAIKVESSPSKKGQEAFISRSVTEPSLTPSDEPMVDLLSLWDVS